MRRHRPPLPKEGKTGDHPYPHVNPPPQRKTAVACPKAREITVTRRSGLEHAEVPPMKECPAVGGRKPLNNHLERFEEEQEDFSCRRVEQTANQQRAPGRQNSKLCTTCGQATNDLIARQTRPITTTGRRTGHGSDKEAQTLDEAVEAAPKWLILHPKQKGTAEPPLQMQKQPQLPYTMTAPSDYRQKRGSSTPHRDRSYCSHTSETTGGWGTTTVPTPSRNSRLARQPLSPYR